MIICSYKVIKLNNLHLQPIFLLSPDFFQVCLIGCKSLSCSCVECLRVRCLIIVIENVLSRYKIQFHNLHFAALGRIKSVSRS